MRLTKAILVAALLVCVLAVADYFSHSQGTVENTPQAAGQQSFFHDLSTVDLAGQTVTSGVFKEKKLTLVNLWATWCPPCVEEIPVLQELSVQYPDVAVKGLLVEVDGKNGQIVTGISDQERSTAEALLKKLQVTYTQWLVSDAMKAEVAKIDGFPTTYFVDQGGNLVGEPILGAASKKEWQQIIEERLQMVK